MDYKSNPLHDYQLYAKNFMLRTPRCGLFLDPGLGKTRITLEAITERNPTTHVLVVAPKNIARATWIDEINKWKFPLRHRSLIVNERGKGLSRAKRLERYEEAYEAPATMYFINQELVADLVRNMPKVHGGYVWYFPNMVIDELQGFKSYRAQRFKTLQRVEPALSTFTGLTGTPDPNGLMDLWSQIYLMDHGERLGRTITAYRNQFFREGLRVNGYPVSWIPLPGAEDEIYRRISDLVISVKNPNVTLPPVTYNTVPVHLDDKELKMFKKFAREQILELGDGDPLMAVNRGVLSQRLSQLASGTAYTDAKAGEFVTIHRHKVEMCDYIINNAQGSVLIAYHFKAERDLLLESFPDARAFDGTPDMIAAWNRGEIPVMLLQPASAGHGLNLQDGGHTLIWFTIYTNLEEYIQTNARLARQGQKNPVVIHHLVAEGTTDAANLAMLNQKDDAEQRLLDAVRAIIS